jgi:predicted O-methyltransferase YrrM
MDQFPPLVTRAQAAARQAGFPLTREEAGPGRPSACLPGVGRFLAVLAAGCAGGRIGELGTGAGIGAGWIASCWREGRAPPAAVRCRRRPRGARR